MKQAVCTIRTTNFATMREFYQERLRLKAMTPVTDEDIWFRDFQTEIHIEAVLSCEEVGTTGCLRFLASDVIGVAHMLQERGVPVKVREVESGNEALIRDPDGNIILVVAESASDA